MMALIGFCIGAAIAGLIGIALGICVGLDIAFGVRRYEQLDIAPAIARDRSKHRG